MNPFDEAMALADEDVFEDVSEPIILGGICILASVGPLSSGETTDSYGGRARVESLRIDVRKCVLAEALIFSVPVGTGVTVDPDAPVPRQYRFVFQRDLGSSLALFCESTAGTGKAEF
jgi:hypothetical protein